jgi:hypothetical protein
VRGANPEDRIPDALRANGDSASRGFVDWNVWLLSRAAMPVTMMTPTEQLEVVDIGGASFSPSSTVMRFAAFGRCVTVLGDAVPVARDQRIPLCPRDRARRATYIEDF